MKWFSKQVAILLLSSLCSPCFASIDSDLNSFFDSLGYSSNVTAPQAYDGQRAGYYTGGSLFARNQVRNTQLAAVQMPSFRGGCGGIDLYTGGFSFVNSEELIDAMKNIANNATSYAFMLAIETVSPLIGEQMKNLQSIANTVNNANINSCEAAASLVGGAWPKTDIAQKQVCESIGTSNNLFSDWAAARQGCGAAGQRSQVLANGKHDPRFKDMIVEDGNIAWRALLKNDFLANDPQLAELFMSLSGSIIIRKNGINDDATHETVPLASLANHKDLLKALMYGDEALMYQCDDKSIDGCLHPTQVKVNISKDKALVNQVKSLLTDMLSKIYSDEPLTEKEIGLLQTTKIPIYKMLNVNAAYSPGSPVIDVTSYAEVIATDVLYQYLTESLDVVSTSTNNLQYPSDMMEQFKHGLAEAKAQVAEQRRQNTSQINAALQMIQQTQLLEQQLSGQLSNSIMNNFK